MKTVRVHQIGLPVFHQHIQIIEIADYCGGCVKHCHSLIKILKYPDHQIAGDFFAKTGFAVTQNCFSAGQIPHCVSDNIFTGFIQRQILRRHNALRQIFRKHRQFLLMFGNASARRLLLRQRQIIIRMIGRLE